MQWDTDQFSHENEQNLDLFSARTGHRYISLTFSNHKAERCTKNAAHKEDKVMRKLCFEKSFVILN